MPVTSNFVDRTYRYAGLDGAGWGSRPRLDPTAAGIARTLAYPMIRLADAEAARGDSLAARRRVERAARLSAMPGLAQPEAGQKPLSSRNVQTPSGQ